MAETTMDDESFFKKDISPRRTILGSWFREGNEMRRTSRREDAADWLINVSLQLQVCQNRQGDGFHHRVYKKSGGQRRPRRVHGLAKVSCEYHVPTTIYSQRGWFPASTTVVLTHHFRSTFAPFAARWRFSRFTTRLQPVGIFRGSQHIHGPSRFPEARSTSAACQNVPGFAAHPQHAVSLCLSIVSSYPEIPDNLNSWNLPGFLGICDFCRIYRICEICNFRRIYEVHKFS
jgi:hypothetical protein